MQETGSGRVRQTAFPDPAVTGERSNGSAHALEPERQVRTPGDPGMRVVVSRVTRRAPAAASIHTGGSSSRCPCRSGPIPRACARRARTVGRLSRGPAARVWISPRTGSSARISTPCGLPSASVTAFEAPVNAVIQVHVAVRGGPNTALVPERPADSLGGVGCGILGAFVRLASRRCARRRHSTERSAEISRAPQEARCDQAGRAREKGRRKRPSRISKAPAAMPPSSPRTPRAPNTGRR